MSTTGYAYAQWYEKQRLGRARLDRYWLRYNSKLKLILNCLDFSQRNNL